MPGTLPLPEGTQGRVEVALGRAESAQVEATALRRQDLAGVVAYGFWVPQPDEAWQRCVAALDAGQTHADLAEPAAPAAPIAAISPAVPVGLHAVLHTTPAGLQQPLAPNRAVPA